jgi:hypothetical protein
VAFIAFGGAISGQGSNVFGATAQVLFVAVDLGVLGDTVRLTEPLYSDHMLRAGWFSLGDNFDPGDGTTRDYWRSAIWCDFPQTLWTPNATHSGSGLDPLTVLATRIRWSLSPGTSGYLEVFAL